MPYATMGSGSLAAMAVFESQYKDDMDEKEAIEIVDQAIQAGIWNDLGSGSNVDICVIPNVCTCRRKFFVFIVPKNLFFTFCRKENLKCFETTKPSTRISSLFFLVV